MLWIIGLVIVGIIASVVVVPFLATLLIGWAVIVCARIGFAWSKRRATARIKPNGRPGGRRLQVRRALPVLQVNGALIDQNRVGPDEAALLARMRQARR